MTEASASPASRRAFLARLAGAAAAISFGSCRSGGGARQPEHDRAAEFHWSGIGFGIDMTMEVHGASAANGESLGRICEDTIRQLERSFSLYQEASELRTLNRDRLLPEPSPLFRRLLDLSIDLHRRTLGYFQPAVHGAWRWLEQRGGTEGLEQDPAWNEHCASCDLGFVAIDPDGPVRLTHPLTRLSMNAIGQGFLADTVAARLRKDGVTSAMLHLGESYAIGNHPEGRPWNLAVMGLPANGETGLVGSIEFTDAGLAVSAGDENRLLIDPVSRSVLHQPRVVAVVSTEGAAVADAFATAFAVAPEDKWTALAGNLGRVSGSQVRVWEKGRLAFEIP